MDFNISVDHEKRNLGKVNRQHAGKKVRPAQLLQAACPSGLILLNDTFLNAYRDRHSSLLDIKLTLSHVGLSFRLPLDSAFHVVFPMCTV